ncbi:hypothetical protein BC834DRAFT_863099 [Gloeopeniophorella convolvens]|nr:hypothetical protein BC834DRAFT_863099 [Gloeopeniophorella convolvens]
MRPAILFAFVFALAGQALAQNNTGVFNINVGGSVGNVTADHFLTVQDVTLSNQCQTSCQPAITAIQNCAADKKCLCSDDTVTDVTKCQQCYFNNIIQDNRRVSDPRAGSTPALAAYVAACGVNTTDSPGFPVNVSTALTIQGADWDGPESLNINLGETILYVGFGAIIGVGSIAILCTM